MQQGRRVGRTEPSPVEASSHEGLKVDGAGERCKGASRQEKERGGDDGRDGGTGVVSNGDTGEEQQSSHKMRPSPAPIKLNARLSGPLSSRCCFSECWVMGSSLGQGLLGHVETPEYFGTTWLNCSLQEHGLAGGTK